jgi:hypothetical protein
MGLADAKTGGLARTVAFVARAVGEAGGPLTAELGVEVELGVVGTAGVGSGVARVVSILAKGGMGAWAPATSAAVGDACVLSVAVGGASA